MIKERKINIFIAQTEYHLMCSINIALTSYSCETFENHIYYKKGKKRLNYDLNPINDFNGFIRSIQADREIEQLKLLKKVNCFRFFFFQENNIFNKYLAYHLKKKGTIVCLAPDGLKPYGEFTKKHETLSLIKDTFIDYLFLAKNKILLPAIIPSRYYRYGSSKIIDEVWLHDINLFNAALNKTKAKLITLPEFWPNHLEKISNAFPFNSEILEEINGIIFYVNQPLWSDELAQHEINILHQIVQFFQFNTVYIKLHPNTPISTIDQYKTFGNVKLIQSNIPAEFYISLLTGSIIISGWSAALLHNKKGNNYYYTYRLFINSKDKILSQIKIQPFKHIYAIDSINEVQFPD